MAHRADILRLIPTHHTLRQGRAYLLLAAILAIATPAKGKLDPLLEPFLGHWTGTYTVSSLEGKPLGGGPIEVISEESNDILWVETRFKEQAGDRREFGWTRIENGHLTNSIERNGKTFTFSGWVHDGKIWWLPEDPILRMNQIHHEFVRKTDNGRELILRGIEIIFRSDGYRFVLSEAILTPASDKLRPVF